MTQRNSTDVFFTGFTRWECGVCSPRIASASGAGYVLWEECSPIWDAPSITDTYCQVTELKMLFGAPGCSRHLWWAETETVNELHTVVESCLQRVTLFLTKCSTFHISTSFFKLEMLAVILTLRKIKIMTCCSKG